VDFRLSSSRHALQKSLPFETVSSSSGCSLTCCAGLTDFGSHRPREQLHRFPLGGLVHTLLFLAISDSLGARSVLRIDLGSEVTASALVMPLVDSESTLQSNSSNPVFHQIQWVSLQRCQCHHSNDPSSHKAGKTVLPTR